MTHIVIFAKAPQPGHVKTRLIPALGADGAAALAQRFLAHTLQQALAANAGGVELCMSPDPIAPSWHSLALPTTVVATAQGVGDLGERLARAVMRNMHDELAALRGVMLVGTDCPALTGTLLKQAAQQLQTHDAVMLPAHDGGYVLLGLKSPSPELFEKMAWSTSVVAAETLRRMAALNLRVWQGPTLHDIDEPADLQHVPNFLLQPLPSNRATA